LRYVIKIEDPEILVELTRAEGWEKNFREKSQPRFRQVPDRFRSVDSHAFEVPAGKRLLFISGQFGVAPDGMLQADFAGQCKQAMGNVEALLDAAGMTKANLAKITYLLTRVTDAPILGQIRHARWSAVEPPSVTAFV